MKDEIVTERKCSGGRREGVIAETCEPQPYNIEEAKNYRHRLRLLRQSGGCEAESARRARDRSGRRREVRKLAKKDGFYAADFAFGPEEAMGAAMLVNTVPAPVVTGAIIRELPRDAYILDIASKPGGTDLPAPESAASVRISHLDFRENMRRRRAPIFWTGRWRDSCERSMKCDGFFQL